MSSLSIPSEPGGASFTPVLLLQSRRKGCSGVCPGWWGHKPGHVKRAQLPDPSSLMARGKPSFFQNKSYWFIYAGLTFSLFLYICFRCVSPFGQSFLYAFDPNPCVLCNFVSYIIPSFTPILFVVVIFFLMQCFVSFFIIKVSIAVEVHGNKTHYHMSIKLFLVPFYLLSQGLCRDGVLGKGRARNRDHWRVSGEGISWGRRRGMKKTNLLDKRVSKELF